MSDHYGVLIEAVSIQQYIFQSNKLKTNLGASWLIQHALFDIHLKEAVKEICGGTSVENWNAWKSRPDEIQIQSQAFEVGYIGGGNAFLLFREKGDAMNVIEAWTRRLLLEAPGITTAVAVAPFNLDRFKNSIKDLHSILAVNKCCHIPQTILPRHGITAECPTSGLSAEVWDSQQKAYISSVADAKIAAVKSSRDAFHLQFEHELGEEYCFPADFEKLGSICGEDSHIALVHIDGNRMAQRFRKMDSLVDTRKLSDSVHNATLATFRDLVRMIVQDYSSIMIDLGFDGSIKDSRFQPPLDDKKKCLPITPIILGGDDVTFVCDGKLGVYFARFFIESFESRSVSDGRPISACAGVAVIKTKYPFYRGYHLAEELCASAKALNAEQQEPERLTSGLDFQIAMAGVHGGLQDIRKQQYMAPGGNLLCRPYPLGRLENTTDFNLKSLLSGVAVLRDRKNFPRTKLKELRSVLSMSEGAREQYLQESRLRKRRLPGIEGHNFEEKLFINRRTIYFDMLELTEFYPPYALSGS